MILKNIEINDIDGLIEIARKAHQESKYCHFPFSPDSVRKTFIEHIGNSDAIAVKCIADKIAGFFIGGRNGMVFTDMPIGMETTYYVLPEYRGSRCFFLLINAFKSWCRENSLTPFLLPHFGKNNSKIYSALEKMGFHEIGRFYAGDF